MAVISLILATSKQKRFSSTSIGSSSTDGGRLVETICFSLALISTSKLMQLSCTNWLLLSNKSSTVMKFEMPQFKRFVLNLKAPSDRSKCAGVGYRPNENGIKRNVIDALTAQWLMLSSLPQCRNTRNESPVRWNWMRHRIPRNWNALENSFFSWSTFANVKQAEVFCISIVSCVCCLLRSDQECECNELFCSAAGNVLALAMLSSE